MARLVEAGADVRYVRLLDRDALAAGGLPPDTLAREVREATAELGIPEANLTVHDFDVRTFPTTQDRRAGGSTRPSTIAATATRSTSATSPGRTGSTSTATSPRCSRSTASLPEGPAEGTVPDAMSEPLGRSIVDEDAGEATEEARWPR
jgi:hypothetical protein